MRPSSDSSTNSDRMSGQLNDLILMLHAPDGSMWSSFMSTRLDAPPYEIRSISKDLTILEGPPEDDADKDDGDAEGEGELYLNTSDILAKHTTAAGSDDNKTEGDTNNNNYNNTSTTLSNEAAESGPPSVKPRTSSNTSEARGEADDHQSIPGLKTESCVSAVTLTDNSCIDDCILYSRACVIFLSPDIIEGERPFPIDISTLSPRSTLFLFLGVDIQEVRRFFGSESDLVFRCRCSHIDGSEGSICDALLQVVHAYEDTGGSSSLGGGSDLQDFDPDDASGGGIYNTPSSVQLNRVERVFPRELTGGDRVVYVLLEQRPEHEVVVEIGSTKDEFPLTQVCGRLFTFTVPEGIRGKVSFIIGSQGHEIGSESVRLMSRLDQLREILAEENDPKTILASAAGVAPGDEAALDTALAFKLQQLASAQTFAAMFPVEEGLKSKGSAKQVMYPSLLHFAADYNLRTFCSELLKYPSMVGAVQAENRDGETPRQVAARKKFLQLESDLLHFATRHGVSAIEPSAAPEEDYTEDNTYVQASPAQNPRPPPPPPPHRPVKGTGYVNSGVQDYISMGELRPEKSDLINVKHQMSHVETGSRKDIKEFPGIATFRHDDYNDEGPTKYQNMESFTVDSGINPGSRPGSARSSPRDRLDSPTSPDDSPRTSARKAYKVMGVTEDEVNRSHSPFKSHSFDSGDDNVSSHMPVRNQFYSSSTPKNLGLGFVAQAEGNRDSFSSNYSLDQFDANEQISPKQSKGKMKIFKNMFTRGKGKGKRSSSISEMESTQIKTALGGRNQRRGSESSITAQQREAQEERDSGSYSDEEKPAVPVARRSSKNKVFKEREATMDRRLSRRARAAINEKIPTAPTLPSRRRGAFRSFILE